MTNNKSESIWKLYFKSDLEIILLVKADSLLRAKSKALAVARKNKGMILYKIEQAFLPHERGTYKRDRQFKRNKGMKNNMEIKKNMEDKNNGIT